MQILAQQQWLCLKVSNADMKEEGVLITGIQQQKTFHNEHIFNLKQ